MTPREGPLDDELAALTTWVGYSPPRVVTDEAIRRFAETLRRVVPPTDTGSDESDLVAPATFFCPDPVAAVDAMGLVRPTRPARSIDGGSRWEPGVVTRAGDVLTSVGRVARVSVRRLEDGRVMVKTECEVRTWNQRGELAGVAGGTILNYEGRVPA